jgi:alpha-L-fucosidase
MGKRVPDWYRDAKLGIMIHWGLPSVPAFASTGHGTLTEMLSSGDWTSYFRHNPYSEWYQNSLRLRAEETVAFHRRRFNRSFPYERLSSVFNDSSAKWKPDEWADLFAEAGARYVVLVSKHHDGFLMWPSERPPRVPGYVSARDVVGELAEAARERGLRYGLYYSGLLDWTEQTEPIRDFVDMMSSPTGEEYGEYVTAHFTELIHRYKPDVLWNDIGLPPEVNRRKLFTMYRDQVPEGVLNDRWAQLSASASRFMKRPAVRRFVNERARRAVAAGRSSSRAGDVRTVEYGANHSLQADPWEAVRSVGHSFAWNDAEPQEDYLSGPQLIQTLVDIVSKNGNLLLNIGPAPDGRIPDAQRQPLIELAVWLRHNSDAIHGTRPWHRAEGKTADGQEVRFTTRPGRLYAIVLNRPRRLGLELPGLEVSKIPGHNRKSGLSVRVLGCEAPAPWRLDEDQLEVRLPGSFVPNGPVAIEISVHPEDSKPPAIEMYTDVIG